jgi:hypothetical protein
MRRFLSGCVGVVLAVLLAGYVFYYIFDRPEPTAQETSAWERNFRTVLPPDYRDFRGHWLNTDSSSYLFSYSSMSSLKDLPSALNHSTPIFRNITTDGESLYMTSDVGSWTIKRNDAEGRFYVLFARQRTHQETPKGHFERLKKISGGI